jgi:hypothetical protein
VDVGSFQLQGTESIDEARQHESYTQSKEQRAKSKEQMISPLRVGLIFMALLNATYMSVYMSPFDTLKKLFGDGDSSFTSASTTQGELFLVTCLGAYMIFFGCICGSIAAFGGRNGHRCVMWTYVLKSIFFVRFYYVVAPKFNKLPESQIVFGYQFWAFVGSVCLLLCLVDLFWYHEKPKKQEGTTS